MISNKFKVGWRYKYNGDGLISSGIVEITRVDNGRIYYKIIKGMRDDTDNHSFDEGSNFSTQFSLIKNKKNGFLL